MTKQSADHVAREAGFRSAAEEEAHVRAHLDDLYAELRAKGQAPSPSELWAEAHGLSDPEQALTIAEAARRENVSERTVRRRLSDLEALDPPGAWRAGRIWRVRPDALTVLRTVRAAETSVKRRRRARTTVAPTSTKWSV